MFANVSTPFTLTSEIHSRILRSICPIQLYSPKPRSDLYKHSFQYSGVSIWNNLPVHLQHSPQLMSLKQDTLSGCKIRAYLSNSVLLFFRYFLMFSSCIVHCNNVYIYCVRMYVNCSTYIVVCLSCSVSCSVLLLMKTSW